MKLVKNILAILLVSIIAFSCKSDKKEAETVEEVVVATDEQMTEDSNGVEELDESESVDTETDMEAVKSNEISVIYPKDTKLQDQVKSSMSMMAKENPNVRKMYNSAYGYVVFPKITKGGLIVGGAGGHGLVFEKNTVIGSSTLMQATLGAQIGGQQYAEYIFFENKAALDRFTNNKFKLAGGISAVALDKAVSGNIDYQDGVAVYTHANKGLMAEATLGTQKFKYKDGIN